MAPSIEHVVVLMLENRSFDHILGFLDGGQRRFDGLQGNETNPIDPADPSKGQANIRMTAGTEGYVTQPDPHHEFEDVTFHLFAGGALQATSVPTNSGFYARYAQIADADHASQAMWAFDTAAQLPAIAALARNFAILDRWFASVPGPTWPNRFFAHCASSGGHVESPTDAGAIWAEAGHSIYGMPTIFENLGAVGHTWGIYYHDVPQAMALARLHDYRTRFKHVGAFFAAAAAGTLPAYSFIEPAYFNVPGLGLIANDMHPPHDVRRGDALVASVYNALRASPQWENTLLLIVWDEHGAFYDHVPPPWGATPPDRTPGTGPFGFDRLGVRVPAIAVSPYIEAGTVDHAQYDHASIPATLRKLFGLSSPLTRRDAVANTFEGVLSRTTARDSPASVASVQEPSLEEEVVDDLSDLQKKLLGLARNLDLAAAPAASESASPGELVLRVARYFDV